MPSLLTMFQVDAFADGLFAGNPAAMLILDAPLDGGLMQAIAMENNLSETAFAVRNGETNTIADPTRWAPSRPPIEMTRPG